jgi:hypothetical protein
MAFAAQAKVDHFARSSRPVPAHIMAQQVVAEENIAGPAGDRARLG